MTHEEISLRTKTALSNSLKELMKHKPFYKITVSELIRDCNINRKTFYYHFEDIYDLLKWILEQEAIEVVKNFNFTTNCKDAILFVINYVENNSFFLNCIYDSIGRDELKKRFFYNDFIEIIEKFIRCTEKNMNITISDNFRFFLCNLYTEGIAGMIINLFQHPNEYNKEQLVEYFTMMLENSIPAVISGTKN